MNPVGVVFEEYFESCGPSVESCTPRSSLFSPMSRKRINVASHKRSNNSKVIVNCRRSKET